MTQLTKDDVEWIDGVKYIAVSKIKQVSKFYERCRDKQYFDGTGKPFLGDDVPKSINSKWSSTNQYADCIDKGSQTYMITKYNDWLFNYCFKDGLK